MAGRFVDARGRIHRVDSRSNHFINGKCVNPFKDSDTKIGDTLPKKGLTPTPSKVVVTGHVAQFEYFDHDAREMVYVGY